jgi:hypothetical protein
MFCRAKGCRLFSKHKLSHGNAHNENYVFEIPTHPCYNTLKQKTA